MVKGQGKTKSKGKVKVVRGTGANKVVKTKVKCIRKAKVKTQAKKCLKQRLGIGQAVAVNQGCGDVVKKQPRQQVPKRKVAKAIGEGLELRYTPWSDRVELSHVYHDFYAPLGFEPAKGEAESGPFVIDVKQGEQPWQRALDRIVLWKRRCGNIAQPSQRQFLLQHLSTLESFLVILLEELRGQTDLGHRSSGAGGHSRLYQLYSIGVINYVTVVESYSEHAGGVLSIRQLARYVECPSWIVTCRHALSHPSLNQPPLAQLNLAISFALQWFDRNFWSKMLSEPSSSPASASLAHQVNPPAKLPPTHEELHHQTCLLLFTSTRKVASRLIVRAIQSYLAAKPNEYIELFVSVLVYDTPRHASNFPAISATFRIPEQLGQRCAKIFKVILASQDCQRLLLLLFNLLVDKIALLQEAKQRQNGVGMEETSGSHRSAYAWLFTLFNSITITTTEGDQCQMNMSASLKKCFTGLDLVGLKRCHEYTWYRLFYTMVRLQPVPSLTRDLLKKVYFFLDHLIPMDKFSEVLRLVDAYCVTSSTTTASSTCTSSTSTSTTINETIKTVESLKTRTNQARQGAMPSIGYLIDDRSWYRIMLGASLPRTLLPFKPEATSKPQVIDVITIAEDDAREVIQLSPPPPPQPFKSTEVITID